MFVSALFSNQPIVFVDKTNTMDNYFYIITHHGGGGCAKKTPLSMENDSQHYKRPESFDADCFVPLYWSIRSNTELHGFHIIHILFAKVCKKWMICWTWQPQLSTYCPFCLPFSSLLELNVLQYYTFSELIYFFHTGERIMAPLCECFSAWGLPPSPHIINIQHLVVESSRLAYTYLDVIIEV